MKVEITHVARSQKKNFALGCKMIRENHYLKSVPDPRSSFEIFEIWLYRDVWIELAGYLVFGRPEAVRCYPWYGSVQDVFSKKTEVTRWQVLNLSRVWLNPKFQRGGEMYGPKFIPGFVDRKGQFQSTLATEAIKTAMSCIGFEYLTYHPPVFLDEPYEIKYLLSYCNTALHRGVIYQRSGFELIRTNRNGIQTWRIPLPGLMTDQVKKIETISKLDSRARKYRRIKFNGLNQPTLTTGQIL